MLEVEQFEKENPNLETVEMKKLREEVFQISQPVFASLLNVKPATVRAWEQGQRTPDGAPARLLEILSNDVESQMSWLLEKVLLNFGELQSGVKQ